jgi:hypothetical protein
MMNERVVRMDLEKEINSLMDSMIFVQNKTLREIMLNSFIKKYGEIPEKYKDAIDALMDL